MPFGWNCALGSCPGHIWKSPLSWSLVTTHEGEDIFLYSNINIKPSLFIFIKWEWDLVDMLQSNSNNFYFVLLTKCLGDHSGFQQRTPKARVAQRTDTHAWHTESPRFYFQYGIASPYLPQFWHLFHYIRVTLVGLNWIEHYIVKPELPG